MRLGMAMPLAVAALLGVAVGYWAPPGLLEAGALVLLWLLGREQWRALGLCAVMAFSASQILLAKGAVLSEGLLQADLALEGTIESVEREEQLSRLMVRVTSCAPLDPARLPCADLQRVRLSFYAAPAIAVGEHWAMTVRLRPPAGFANPGTFDYSAWLWREGIQATGYVRSEPGAERLSVPAWSLREQALDYLDAQPLSPLTRRWLAAVTLGAGDRLEQEDWDLLNASGTTHLVVISGLHVGLVATFVLLVLRGIARLIAPGQWRMAVWPWWAAGAAAIGYAWLAGLQPPAMRAMIMTLVGLWVASGRHAPGPWQAWWLALGLVVLMDPLSVWRPGLWLSFIAVLLLILIWQRRPRPQGLLGWSSGLVRTQLLLAPLMAGAVLLAFARLAPSAPLANLVAVPLVSVILVPLGLLGWLLSPIPYLGAFSWQLFGDITTLLVGFLEVTTDWLPLWWPLPELVLPLALLLGLVSLLWALPGLSAALRVGAMFLLVPAMLTLTPSRPGAETLEVNFHDVGQGQLIELRSANYRLLYDTGPRFTSGFMPLGMLWPQGQRFDDVLVSHADLDHAGGVPALGEHDVGRFLAPAGDSIGVPFEPCRRGQEWKRDGVVYRVLWPPQESMELSSNDRSCVLEVTVGSERLLITGDVSREVERRLLLEVTLPVTLLVAGHHGSQTSSGPQLVQTLLPQYVLYSAGRRNAYGHPHADVVRRFRHAGSCQWSTALDGAVTFHFVESEGVTLHAARRQPWRRDGVDGTCVGVESRQ